MNANVAGVFVPDEFIKIMADASREDRPKRSIEIAASLIKEMKGMCHGVHIMSLGWDRYVSDLLEAGELA